MALEAGTLRVTLQYAKDLKDCDWFGRQDPYVRLRVGNQERRSRTHRDGGRNPVWNETFDFSVINENTLELTLMDEDTLSRDDLIGTGTVSLARVREQGTDTVQVPVSSGKKVQKQKGFVQLSLSFSPNSRLHPNPYQQPAGMPAAAAYVYPQPTAPPAAACMCPHPPHPAPGAYAYPPPAQAPAYAPPPPTYYSTPSYHYSPSFAAPPAPAPQAPAPWPGAHAYAAPAAPQPSYYPPPPTAPPPAYGQPLYYGAAPSYRG